MGGSPTRMEKEYGSLFVALLKKVKERYYEPDNENPKDKRFFLW